MGNKFDFHNTLKLEKADTWIENTMQHHYRLVQSKKDALIKDKLKEKGFGHLIEGMERRKFPKITCIIQNEWHYYYADDDTEEGVFIVAIKDNFKNNLDNLNAYEITYEFQWQDKFPIVEYKHLPNFLHL